MTHLLKLVDKMYTYEMIQRALLKIQNRHNFVHRRTEGRTNGWTDKVDPVYPIFNFVEAGRPGISVFNFKRLNSLRPSKAYMRDAYMRQ